MTTTYRVIRYAADGHAGEPSDGKAIATGTLRWCRAAIRRALQLRNLHGRRWDPPDAVEAYHDLPASHPDAYGCGGYSIVMEKPIA